MRRGDYEDATEIHPAADRRSSFFGGQEGDDCYYARRRPGRHFIIPTSYQSNEVRQCSWADYTTVERAAAADSEGEDFKHRKEAPLVS